MSERQKLGGLFSGAEEPTPHRSEALRARRASSAVLRPAAEATPPVEPVKQPSADPSDAPLSQQPSLTMSMDMPTYRRMRAHSEATGEPAPAILNAALSDEAVMAKVNGQWSGTALIPGMRPTRRRPPEGTKTVQFKLGTAGRAFVSGLSSEAHAPSVSAFVSLAIRLYLDSASAQGTTQAD